MSILDAGFTLKPELAVNPALLQKLRLPILAPTYGVLEDLVGTWVGTGFNVIWRPFNPLTESDRFLELNLTNEKLEVSKIDGAIPNRGLLQGDIDMFGVTYVDQISDANLNAGLHFEPGIWARVPATTEPAQGESYVRMASIPHGTTILAQGRSTTVNSAPTIPATSITPFIKGNPSGLITFAEQDLSQVTQFRTTGPGLTGITQPMLDDPNSVLRAVIAGQTITQTIQLDVDTLPLTPGGTNGGTANTVFLGGTAPNTENAFSVDVHATFWIEKLQGQTSFTQLQYTQKVLLNFNGLSWPHITVGTLALQPAHTKPFPWMTLNPNHLPDTLPGPIGGIRIPNLPPHLPVPPRPPEKLG